MADQESGTMAEMFYGCSGSSRSFLNRFQDIPEPIRGEMIDACTGVMRRHLKRAAEEIRRLPMDDDGEVEPTIERLARELEAGAKVGLEVGQYRERLERLRGLWRRREEARERLEEKQERRKRLREELRGLDEELDRDEEEYQNLSFGIPWVASHPWIFEQQEHDDFDEAVEEDEVVDEEEELLQIYEELLEIYD